MSIIHEDERMAGGPGIEPGFTDPKSVVLPLDDPPNQGISPYRAYSHSVKTLDGWVRRYNTRQSNSRTCCHQ